MESTKFVLFTISEEKIDLDSIEKGGDEIFTIINDVKNGTTILSLYYRWFRRNAFTLLH